MKILRINNFGPIGTKTRDAQNKHKGKNTEKWRNIFFFWLEANNYGNKNQETCFVFVPLAK